MKSVFNRAIVTAACISAAAVVVIGQSPARQTGRTSGFYAQEQAARGKTAYDRSCAGCHTIGPNAGPSAPTKVPLGGPEVITRWRTVGDLYSKVRRTMPATNAN